jgi:hypothetical protein
MVSGSGLGLRVSGDQPPGECLPLCPTYPHVDHGTSTGSWKGSAKQVSGDVVTVRSQGSGFRVSVSVSVLGVRVSGPVWVRSQS